MFSSSMTKANPLAHTWPLFAFLTIVTLYNQTAAAADRPAINTLHGVVVSKTDGQPVPGIPVIMAHARQGQLILGPRGALRGSGDDQPQPENYARRNTMTLCDAFTDAQGRFTLRNFALPADQWNLLAGDATHGLALLADLVPQDYADRVLRVELEPLSDILVEPPPHPANRSLRSGVSVAFAPLPTPASAIAIAAQPAAEQPGDAHADAQLRISVMPAGRPTDSNYRETDEPWPLGPLAPGFAYHITHYLWGDSLEYEPIIFQRTVDLRPGTNDTVVLATTPAASVRGRITDRKGAPLADVNVLARLDEGSRLVLGTLTDANGEYELNGVPPGTHTLAAERRVRRTRSDQEPAPRDVFWTGQITLAAGQATLTRDIEQIVVRRAHRRSDAPPFEAPTLAGQPFKLATFQDHVTFIHFWSTSSEASVAELANIAKAYEQYADRGLVVIGINFDPDPQTALDFVARENLKWTHVWAEQAENGPLADLYGVSTIPASFLVDVYGRVIATDLQGEALLTALKEVLPPPQPTSQP